MIMWPIETLLNIKSVNDLLNNDDIIRATTAGKKASSIGGGWWDLIKKMSDAPHKNFGDQFKSGVTKSNYQQIPGYGHSGWGTSGYD